MSHFYSKVNGEWRLSKSIDSVAKARKSPNTYAASVTTKLSLEPNPFIAQWREKRLIELARAHPSGSYESLSEKAWGLRECPITGELISSSDWGTRLHAKLEDYNRGTPDHSPYDPWVDLWHDWRKSNLVEILEAELMIGCEERRIAGMLDFVGVMDGRIFLADYKSRSIGDKDIKTCAYEKDAMQLAIEAKMIQEQWELDYLPDIWTIIFDTDTPRMWPKKWTEAAKKKALDKAERINQAYNLIYQL